LIPSRPDFNRLLQAITRSRVPDRVPFFEIFGQIDAQALDYIKTRDPSFTPVCPADANACAADNNLRTHISGMYALGYDYCTIIPGFEFTKSLRHEDTSDRNYLTSDDAMIRTRADYAAYPWPDAAGMDTSIFDKAAGLLPDGMQTVVYSRGPHLAALYLLGYEGVCYTLVDDEPLLADVINTAGERVLDMYARCTKLPRVGALAMGEDLAFYNGTYLPPDVLRKHVFPWYKKFADLSHSNNMPAVFHSCGNNAAVMDDIIACGFDAKHSFEDKITPVWEAKRRWGDRIALLGGFDMDKVTSMNPDEVKRHAAWMTDACKPGGGWALGTGNSVADYVPAENYVAMLEAGFAHGSYA